MIKIDRETCPSGTRLIAWMGLTDRMIERRVLGWSPGNHVYLGFVNPNAEAEWIAAEKLGDIVVEILPADPAAPTLPGPLLEVWPSEIPDGSVWIYSSQAFEQNYGMREQAMIGEDGNLWARGQFFGASGFSPEDGDRIRRVG